MVGIAFVYSWLYRIGQKKEKSRFERVVTWKLPWVMSREEAETLESKSKLWYIVTVPVRLLNILDMSYVKITIALLPIALVVLLIAHIVSVVRK